MVSLLTSFVIGLNVFKILCTGDPNKATLAKGIQQVFPTAEFVYLSAGYDFTTVAGLDKFRTTIKNYNVFVNASRIDFGVQQALLRIVREEWKAGHVFNIGSVVEYDHFNNLYPDVAKDKLELRKLSIGMCTEQFKTTHIVMGGIKDQSANSELKLDPIHVAKTIKWIVETNDIHVPIIGVENDYWNPEWSKIKCGS